MIKNPPRDEKGRFIKGYHYSSETEWTKENYHHYDRKGEKMPSWFIEKVRREFLINNPAKRPDAKEKIARSKLGDKNPTKRPEVKAKLRLARMKQRIPTHHTKCELEFLSLCEKNNLPFEYVGDGSFWVGRLNPDFKNNNGEKKVIEVFGDYWHKGEDPKDRIDAFGRLGYDCMVIWEHELKNPNSVIEKIKKFEEVEVCV